MKLLICGVSESHCLEMSYYRASLNNNLDTHYFHHDAILQSYIIGGYIGRLINRFLPVEQWIRKMNRDFVITSQRVNPNVILIVGNAKILPGTLITLKILIPKVKIVWLWPDTPINLELGLGQNGSLVDLFGTYSSFSVELFKKLNFQNVIWIPLGFDEKLHFNDQKVDRYTVEIGFVGGWRPEREKVLNFIADSFPSLTIEIHGPYWKKKCSSPLLKDKIKSEGIFGSDLAKFFKETMININVIDDTNFPAANMRFFEISGCEALQLCSTCPEMSEIYKDFDSCLYFSTLEELFYKVDWAIKNKIDVSNIRKKAKEITLMKNTYSTRLKTILESIHYGND